MPYAALTKTFSHIEKTTKRIEKTSILTAFLLLVIQRSGEDDSTSLLQSVYLCINRVSDSLPRFFVTSLRCTQLGPDFGGVELGIGESLLVKAIGESTGRSLNLVKADLKKEGDLGLVAMVRDFLTLENHVNDLQQNSKSTQKTLFKPKPLTVPVVFSNLLEIALTSGHSVLLPLSPYVPLTYIPLSSPSLRRLRLSRSYSPHAKALKRNTSYVVSKEN